MANKTGQSEIPSFGAGGLSATPLEVIGRSFRDAILWLKSEPQDDFTVQEMVQVGSAAECAKAGDLDKAVEELRAVNRDQEARRRRGILRRALAILKLRKRPTIVRSLLSQVLAARAVKRVNDRIESIDRNASSQDIIVRLKHMALRGGHALDELLGISGYPGGKSHSLAEILAGYGDGVYEHMRICAVCGNPPVGEMRQTDGKSWELCASCITNALIIQEEQQGQRRALRKAIEQALKDLEEAIALDPKNEHASENLNAGRRLLQQVR